MYLVRMVPKEKVAQRGGDMSRGEIWTEWGGWILERLGNPIWPVKGPNDKGQMRWEEMVCAILHI